MKKLIGIILAVSMVMATAACGATESDVQHCLVSFSAD